MMNSAIGGAEEDKTNNRKSSVSPSTRRVFPNRGNVDRGGVDGAFKHRDLFQKAQDREKKVDWYAQFQESKERFHQVGMGD